jgi:hypothetical protein
LRKLKNKLLRILQNKVLSTLILTFYFDYYTLSIPQLHIQQLLLFIHKLVHHPETLPAIFVKNNTLLSLAKSEMAMGPFFRTQPNPTHHFTNPTQPNPLSFFKIWTQPNPTHPIIAPKLQQKLVTPVGSTQPNPTHVQMKNFGPNPTQPNPTQPNPTQPNPTQPNPTHGWTQSMAISEPNV